MPVDKKLIDTASNLEQSGKTPAEILNLIKSSQSYSDIGTKIDELRSGGTKDDEIYGYLKTAKVSNTAPIQEPKPETMGDRVAKVGEWMEKKRKEWTTPVNPDAQAPEWAGKYPNTYAALGAVREAGKPVAEGIALGSNITPVGLITGGLKYAAVEQGVSALDKILGNKGETTLGTQAKQALTDTAEGTILQAAGGLVKPVAQGVKKGLGIASESTAKSVTGAAVSELKSTIKDVKAIAKGSERIDQAIKDTTKAYMPKGIGTSPKNAMRGMEKYAKDVTPAVEDIIANKNTIDANGNRLLNFFDKQGAPLKNNLPYSAESQLQAIQTRKPQIWKETLEEIQQASEGGAVVPVKPMVDKIESLLTKEKEALIPDVATRKHIIGIAERMKQYEGPGIPLAQAQQELTQLNAKIFNTSKIEYDSFGKKEVDQYIATYLRNTLDDTIEKFAGTPKYENLKKLYGSYRILEEDTIKAAARSAKKQDFSMFDISDIWIGYHTGVSLLTGNVPGLVAATGSELAKKYMGARMKPDFQLKTMYERVDKLMEQKSRINTPKTEFGKAVQKGMNKQTPIAGGYKLREEAYRSRGDKYPSSVRAKMLRDEPNTNIDLEGLMPSDTALRKARILELREKKGKL
jgi:hypothetical protein